MAVLEQQGEFGSLLQRHRLAAGLSQQRLAERAGLSRRGISDLERGERRTPHGDTVRRLARALGLAAPDRTALLAAARGIAVSDPTVPEAAASEPTRRAGPHRYR
jgi:transcriptional regulator with XRE-family HTH domain